jgi:hypothetical protein
MIFLLVDRGNSSAGGTRYASIDSHLLGGSYALPVPARADLWAGGGVYTGSSYTADYGVDWNGDRFVMSLATKNQ